MCEKIDYQDLLKLKIQELREIVRSGVEEGELKATFAESITYGAEKQEDGDCPAEAYSFSLEYDLE